MLAKFSELQFTVLGSCNESYVDIRKWGAYKVRNEIETKRNKKRRKETKQNERKRKKRKST